MTESNKVAEARTHLAITYVRMRPVGEDDYLTYWEVDPTDPYLADRTPAEVRFNIERRRARQR